LQNIVSIGQAVSEKLV